MLTLEPLGGFMQVRLLTVDAKDATTPAGIILPEKTQEKTRIAEVIAVGPGQYNPFNGGRFDHGVRVGDLVYIMQHAPIKIVHHPKFKGEKETFLVAESDVFAIYMRKDEAIKEGLIKTEVEELVEALAAKLG